MIRILIKLICVLVFFQQSALAKCRTEDVDTSKGVLSHVICRDDQKRYSHEIKWVDRVLLRGDFFSEEANSSSRLLWVLSGRPTAETGCSDRLYLIDLSGDLPKVIQFGVKKACNEFHRASWGDARSVITLKRNVSFVYENRKMTPPAAGEKLWNSIEPPHAGSGLKLEHAIPFVEELALP